VFPTEGVGYEAAAVSILKGSEQVKSAGILVDWLLSKRGQNTLTKCETYFYPVIPETATNPGMPEFTSLKIINYDPYWAGKNRKHLITRWLNEIQIDK
jgi:iron(III) transport system substrate-binding protein